MTFEEVEKAMQFSLDRQAQIKAILQQVAASHAKAEKQVRPLFERFIIEHRNGEDHNDQSVNGQ